MEQTEIIGFQLLDEIVDYLSGFEGKASFIAGGTDLINQMRMEGADCDLILDLSQTEDLNYIVEDGQTLNIGPTTSFSQIAAHPLIQKKATCLAQAAAQIGSIQIRNRATIGGNIATASPAADSMPALTVLGADAHILKLEQGRFLPVEKREIDICGTTLADNELITQISIPMPGDGYRSGFVKLGARTTVCIAKLNMAALVKFNPDQGVIEAGKIALGALAEEPICPDDLSDFLAGRRVDPNLAPALAQQLSELVSGAIADRASCAYKMSAVKGLAYDLVSILFGNEYSFK